MPSAMPSDVSQHIDGNAAQASDVLAPTRHGNETVQSLTWGMKDGKPCITMLRLAKPTWYKEGKKEEYLRWGDLRWTLCSTAMIEHISEMPGLIQTDNVTTFYQNTYATPGDKAAYLERGTAMVGIAKDEQKKKKGKKDKKKKNKVKKQQGAGSKTKKALKTRGMKSKTK